METKIVLGRTSGGTLLLQVVLLIVYYGGFLAIPWWLAWFPSLVYLGFVALVLVVVVVGLLVWALVKR